MGKYIFTSNFENGFGSVSELFRRMITRRDRFAFVASDFQQHREKTDRYFQRFLGFFGEIGIEFGESCVVDGRLSPAQAQRAVAEADVVWLSGGITPTQFRHLEEYRLVELLHDFDGVMIGMSAGAINMGRISVTDEFDDGRYSFYQGIGVAEVTVDPHFKPESFSPDLLRLSRQFPIYGLCDDGAIAVDGDRLEFVGDVYLISGGELRKM